MFRLKKTTDSHTQAVRKTHRKARNAAMDNAAMRNAQCSNGASTCRYKLFADIREGAYQVLNWQASPSCTCRHLWNHGTICSWASLGWLLWFVQGWVQILGCRDRTQRPGTNQSEWCPPATVVHFWPKSRLGHPKTYEFSLSKNLTSGSKYPQNILFYFENRSTELHQWEKWDTLHPNA